MDSRSSDYPVFRKLISFCEKEKNIEDAIKLCDIAINYGVTKYFGKISMLEKVCLCKKRLMRRKIIDNSYLMCVNKTRSIDVVNIDAFFKKLDL